MEEISQNEGLAYLKKTYGILNHYKLCPEGWLPK
jgi:hypothetical protein